MEVYRFRGKRLEDNSFDEQWGVSEPFTPRTITKAVEQAFTDTRFPIGYTGKDKVELYVQECNLEDINADKNESEEVWKIDADEVVSLPYKALEDGQDIDIEEIRAFFQNRGYNEMQEIMRMAERIPYDPSKAVSGRRLDGNSNSKAETNYEAWADEGLIDVERKYIGPTEDINFLSLKEDYRKTLENGKEGISWASPEVEAAIRELSQED